MADYFDVTTDYLLGRTTYYKKASSSAYIASKSSNDFTYAFLRCEFEGLTQIEIEKLAIFAEGLKAGRPHGK
jgi:hypothetical protein